MTWKLLDEKAANGKPYLLGTDLENEVPFIGYWMKLYGCWGLYHLGGYAEDNDPPFQPTHYQELEPGP